MISLLQKPWRKAHPFSQRLLYLVGSSRRVNESSLIHKGEQRYYIDIYSWRSPDGVPRLNNISFSLEIPIEMKVFSYFQGREERYGIFFIRLRFNSLFSDDRHLLMFCYSVTLPHFSPTHRKILATSLHRFHHASTLKRIFLKFFFQKAC